MPTIPSRLRFALLTAGLLLVPLPLVAEVTEVAANGSQQQERWTINLKEADIREFIDQVTDITGETFIIDPRVKGQVTVLSKTPLSLSEVYALFLSVMATHGYSVVSDAGQSSVIPNAEAKAEANDGKASPDKLETRLIQVQQGSVAELIPLIRPLVPQYGHLAAVTSANALIISDRSANIARIETLVRQLDQKSSHDYSVVNLQHAYVMDAAELLNNAMLRGQAKGSGGSQVIADGRTNRLILLGPPEARAK
jgi:general secretion pathway protein D